MPFARWFSGLRDKAGKAKILTRIDRAAQGNLGDHKSVGMGVIELRIDFGPGYRVYIGLDGLQIVILLCGGDKSTQHKDINKAQEYWADYKRRS